MVYVSATRLRLRSPLFLPLFFWHTYRSKRAIERAEGFLGGKLFSDQEMGAWTVTLWDDPKRLVRYRNKGSHGAAMKILGMIADEAVTVRWQQEEMDLPPNDLVRDRLMQSGNFTALPHPSKNHEQRVLPVLSDRTFVEIPLAPRSVANARVSTAMHCVDQ